jgi:hypothetical protein
MAALQNSHIAPGSPQPVSRRTISFVPIGKNCFQILASPLLKLSLIRLLVGSEQVCEASVPQFCSISREAGSPWPARIPQLDRFNTKSDTANCFLRLAAQPTFALDRLSRYEHLLWRQARQIVFTLES